MIKLYSEACSHENYIRTRDLWGSPRRALYIWCSPQRAHYLLVKLPHVCWPHEIILSW